MTDFEMLLELRSMRRETEYQRSEDALTRAIELIEGLLMESKLTLTEAIWREEALAYSFGERWKRGGEIVGDLPRLEQEHRQMAEWLKELEAYRKASEQQPCEDMLNKIKAEIDQKQYDFMDDKDYDEGVRFGLMLAYQTIDKYREGDEK